MGTTRTTQPARHTYRARRGFLIASRCVGGSVARPASLVRASLLTVMFVVTGGSPIAARGTSGGAPSAPARPPAPRVEVRSGAVTTRSGGVPEAEGNGWATDDSITAQVQDGVPTSSSAACTWRVVTGVDPVSGNFREGPVTRTVGGEHETLHQRTCPLTAGTPGSPGRGDSWYRWIRDSTKQRIIDHAANRVTDRLKTLIFRTAPAHDRMVVNVGTWFWVPRLVWKPLSVTAYIETPVGVLKVTVTATPSRLSWEPGNGDEPQWCTGPGTPWRESYGDDETSDCMYTYAHASSTHAGGRFPARTSVEWRVKVTSNFGLGFPLPSIRLGMSTPATVREIQAVLG